jgi:hypothetical protein
MGLPVLSASDQRLGTNTYEGFQATSSMKATPKVPVRKLAASNPALFLGTLFRSSPIMRPAPRMVGMVQMSITDDRFRHLSNVYPTPRMQIIPMTPPGALKIRA